MPRARSARACAACAQEAKGREREKEEIGRGNNRQGEESILNIPFACYSYIFFVLVIVRVMILLGFG